MIDFTPYPLLSSIFLKGQAKMSSLVVKVVNLLNIYD
jgi:hypothetical protein